MNILAIDTSTGYAGVALRCRGETRTRSWVSEHNHGRELMPQILEILELSGCAMSDLDCVAVALGPGGFSAVRVGVSCALGIANPRRTMMVGIPTHYLQAYAHMGIQGADPKASSVVSLIPIGRHQLSAAQYSLPIGDIRASSHLDIVSDVDAASRFSGGTVVTCGEGRFRIEASPGAEKVPNPRPPESMLDIAQETVRQGLEGHWPVRPIYAREPTITRPRPTVRTSIGSTIR